MKLIFSIVILAVLTGCQSVSSLRDYNTPELTKNHSSINQDEYRNVREIAGPKQYFDTASNSGSFFFLTHHDGDIKEGTKLIVQVTQPQWSFYDKAYWAPGVPAKLTKVNDEVGAGSLGGAYIQEVVALEMPEGMLEEYAKSGKDLNPMLYGKSNDKKIKVQNAYIKGFYQFLEENR